MTSSQSSSAKELFSSNEDFRYSKDELRYSKEGKIIFIDVTGDWSSGNYKDAMEIISWVMSHRVKPCILFIYGHNAMYFGSIFVKKVCGIVRKVPFSIYILKDWKLEHYENKYDRRLMEQTIVFRANKKELTEEFKIISNNRVAPLFIVPGPNIDDIIKSGIKNLPRQLYDSQWRIICGNSHGIANFIDRAVAIRRDALTKEEWYTLDSSEKYISDEIRGWKSGFATANTYDTSRSFQDTANIISYKVSLCKRTTLLALHIWQSENDAETLACLTECDITQIKMDLEFLKEKKIINFYESDGITFWRPELSENIRQILIKSCNEFIKELGSEWFSIL